MQMEVRKYNRHALALVEPEALEPSSADVDALPVRRQDADGLARPDGSSGL